jgi:arsenate reductase (thioredoxin)
MKYVLFVCTHNAGRSQIAQAFFERYAPADIHAESAGEEPASAIWPNVVEAMREVGIDISHRRPKKLDLEMQLHADWAITLHCKASCPFVPSQVEDWDVADPAGQPLELVREIRDEIEQRVRDFVETRVDDVRTDETAHRLRLQKLIPSLVAEFGDEKPAEEIRACADAVLAEFADVPVRSFVLTLAHRRTRECLRDGSCAELVASL